eukprot:364615-Chlamydomonas_euryale.AAC.33
MKERAFCVVSCMAYCVGCNICMHAGAAAVPQCSVDCCPNSLQRHGGQMVLRPPTGGQVLRTTSLSGG